MKLNKQNCDLKSCMLCRHCQPDWLPAIDANRKSYHFKRGELLFKEGEPVTGMYFIKSGLVKIHTKWGNDKELILRIAKTGDIAGHRGLGGDLFYPVSATALEATDACFIDLAFFNSTLRVNIDFIHWLMMFFAGELRESEKRMRNLAHMSVKGRVANALLRFNEKFGTAAGGELAINLSKQDMASYIGTTYETLFRVMNELADENIIRYEGKNIYVTNHQKLIDLTFAN